MDLATTHLSTDLDGLAALVAVKRLEPEMELVLPGSMDPGARRFWSEQSGALPPLLPLARARERLEREAGGRLWVVDTADPARIGEIATWADRFAEVRAWDTHPAAPTDFERAPMPEVAACTSAWVLALEERGIRPPAEEAGLFLLGIHVDTGHFTFPATCPLDHRAASICLAWGAPLRWVARYVPKGYTAHQLERLAEIARSVEEIETPAGLVAVARLDLESYEPDLSVLLEEMRGAERWPAAFLLAGRGGRVDVIGRSAGGVDVGAILRLLGGGGHAEAASAVLKGATLREARALLGQAIEDCLGRERLAGDLAASPFVHLPATASVRDAAERMRQRRIDALPLTRGKGARLAFTGLVNRRDVDAALAHGLGDRPVGEISMGPPQWIAPDRPVAEARLALLSPSSRLLLVGRPPDEAVGVLTRGAVLRALDEPALAAAVRQPPRNEVLGRMRKGLGDRWPLVEKLGDLAGERGLGLHLVGGAVRDLLLSLPVHDVDLAVEGSALALAREAARRWGGEVHGHEAFGTAAWVVEGARVDLASARAEHYRQIASLPVVELHAGLRQDLFRRDFTVNAMAISVDPAERGRLYDPFGGLADLRAGRLRVLHGLSFHDDPTRAFRAARFAARFDFRLAPETEGLLQAARKAGAFERLGRERLGAELERILDAKEVVQAFRLLRDWKLLPAICPGFAGDRVFLQRLGRARDRRNLVEGILGKAQTPGQAEVLWIEVGAAIPKEGRKDCARLVPGGKGRLRRFLYGDERIQAALAGVEGANRPAEAARALESLDLAELIVAWARARRRAARVEWWLREGRHIRPAVKGEQLLAEGHRAGPLLGRALEAAKEVAWEGGDAEAQRAAARAILQNP